MQISILKFNINMNMNELTKTSFSSHNTKFIN